MKQLRLAIAVIALAAINFALFVPAKAASGATHDQRRPSLTRAAFIYNLGFEDFAGFRIAVDPSGKAWAIDGGGQTSGELESDMARRFFSDLLAAGPLQKLPAQRCHYSEPGIQFSTNVVAPLIITWKGQSSPDLTCASDARAQSLRADVATIQRALGVQSYRVRAIAFGQNTTANVYSPAGSGSYQQPASPNARDYSSNNAGGYMNSCGCSLSGFDAGRFDAGRFNAGRFAADPFSAGGFTTSRFGSDRFIGDRFSSEAFAAANFNFRATDFHTDAFSSFNMSFNNGGFNNGSFGSGGFSTGSFNNGGFSGGNFGSGNFSGYPGP